MVRVCLRETGVLLVITILGKGKTRKTSSIWDFAQNLCASTKGIGSSKVNSVEKGNSF